MAAIPSEGNNGNVSGIRDAILADFENIQIWENRSGARAPHKPLLLLHALGRWAQGNRDGICFRETEDDFLHLLREFGPSHARENPHYPFWRLQHDQVWEVSDAEKISCTSSGNAYIGDLRKFNNRGQFSQPIRTALEQDPALALDIAMLLLERHFARTLHADILNAIGLAPASFGQIPRPPRPRDPQFRDSVLAAYQHRCSVCRFDLRMGSHSLALDAAHIQWHCQDGPDTVPNGLALCSIHHKIFDRGAFTISDGLHIQVSGRVEGTGGNALRRLNGQPIDRPNQIEQEPAREFLAWHRAEVFRGTTGA